MNLAPTKVRGALTCLLLALVCSGAQAQVERYIEGVHYTRLPALPAAYAMPVDAGQKSVLEVFWYGCGHCYAFDPLLNAWVEEHADAVSFSRTPMIWNATTKNHARLFFTTAALGLHAAMHARIFDEIHQQGNHLLEEYAVSALFGEYGIARHAFENAWTSFTLDAQLRKAETWQREVFIPGVPALIVNGAFLINTTEQVRTHQMMLDVAEFLLDK